MPTTITNPRIEIYLKSRKLHLYSDNHFIKQYPVAIGKPNTPTPPGQFAIQTKIMYPGGVFGTRWMEFKPRYGIHGTNNPASIGTMASLGCVRMFNEDVNELFNKVRIGTPVHIMSQVVPDHFPENSVQPTIPIINPNNPSDSGNSGNRVHVVRSGDTLWQIAQQYGVTVNQLLAINHLANPNRLTVGQIIKIP